MPIYPIDFKIEAATPTEAKTKMTALTVIATKLNTKELAALTVIATKLNAKEIVALAETVEKKPGTVKMAKMFLGL